MLSLLSFRGQIRIIPDLTTALPTVQPPSPAIASTSYTLLYLILTRRCTLSIRCPGCEETSVRREEFGAVPRESARCTQRGFADGRAEGVSGER